MYSSEHSFDTLFHSRRNHSTPKLFKSDTLDCNLDSSRIENFDFLDKAGHTAIVSSKVALALFGVKFHSENQNNIFRLTNLADDEDPETTNDFNISSVLTILSYKLIKFLLNDIFSKLLDSSPNYEKLIQRYLEGNPTALSEQSNPNLYVYHDQFSIRKLNMNNPLQPGYCLVNPRKNVSIEAKSNLKTCDLHQMLPISSPFNYDLHVQFGFAKLRNKGISIKEDLLDYVYDETEVPFATFDDVKQVSTCSKHLIPIKHALIQRQDTLAKDHDVKQFNAASNKVVVTKLVGEKMPRSKPNRARTRNKNSASPNAANIKDFIAMNLNACNKYCSSLLSKELYFLKSNLTENKEVVQKKLYSLQPPCEGSNVSAIPAIRKKQVLAATTKRSMKIAPSNLEDVHLLDNKKNNMISTIQSRPYKQNTKFSELLDFGMVYPFALFKTDKNSKVLPPSYSQIRVSNSKYNKQMLKREAKTLNHSFIVQSFRNVSSPKSTKATKAITYNKNSLQRNKPNVRKASVNIHQSNSFTSEIQSHKSHSLKEFRSNKISAFDVHHSNSSNQVIINVTQNTFFSPSAKPPLPDSNQNTFLKVNDSTPSKCKPSSVNKSSLPPLEDFDLFLFNPKITEKDEKKTFDENFTLNMICSKDVFSSEMKNSEGKLKQDQPDKTDFLSVNPRSATSSYLIHSIPTDVNTNVNEAKVLCRDPLSISARSCDHDAFSFPPVKQVTSIEPSSIAKDLYRLESRDFEENSSLKEVHVVLPEDNLVAPNKDNRVSEAVDFSQELKESHDIQTNEEIPYKRKQPDSRFQRVDKENRFSKERFMTNKSKGLPKEFKDLANAKAFSSFFTTSSKSSLSKQDSVVSMSQSLGDIVLTQPGYYTQPPFETLHTMINDQGRCVVTDFLIGRKGYGSLFFEGSVDITGMNFDEIVQIGRKEVTVYPLDHQKPPIGYGLNRQAEVTLHNSWPIDSETLQPITDFNTLKQCKWEQDLKLVTEKMGAHFLDFKYATGSWVFLVDHFSQYWL